MSGVAVLIGVAAYLMTIGVILGLMIFWVNRIAIIVIDLRRRVAALEQQAADKRPSPNPIENFRCL